VLNNPSYKERGKLTENMRKRLTKAAHSAIIIRSKELGTRKAIRKLQRDLMNGPLHCFGYHTRCNDDFCKTAPNKKANINSNTAPDASLPDQFHDPIDWLSTQLSSLSLSPQLNSTQHSICVQHHSSSPQSDSMLQKHSVVPQSSSMPQQSSVPHRGISSIANKCPMGSSSISLYYLG